ncbi:MAG: 30S ribosome-binding factor RbfA [Verrucomicrobiaceae bacterium]|nr:MAG: 30S ribosome-binding factor RbfA [Verrucomicrobiaceae bacterium]
MTNRVARVRALIQQELGTMIARDHAFPDVLVTINDVDLTPDLRNAHIFIGVLGPPAKQQAAVDQLNASRGLLSSRLSKRVVLRNTPHLHFKLDHSVERGVRVTALMEEIDKQLIESAILNPEPPAEEEAGAVPAEAAATGETPTAPKTAAASRTDDDDDDDEPEDGENPPPLRRRTRR